MADSSFDIVNKLNRQEADNALNQASKEIQTRYDFRGSNAEIKWSGEMNIIISADSEEKVKAALEILKEKFIRRNISLKSLKAKDPQASGKQFLIKIELVEGITSDIAKKINKKIKEEAPKSIKSQIQGEELRVSSKNRDDLQAVIAMLKASDFDVDLQFVNYR